MQTRRFGALCLPQSLASQVSIRQAATLWKIRSNLVNPCEGREDSRPIGTSRGPLNLLPWLHTILLVCDIPS